MKLGIPDWMNRVLQDRIRHVSTEYPVYPPDPVRNRWGTARKSLRFVPAVVLSPGIHSHPIGG